MWRKATRVNTFFFFFIIFSTESENAENGKTGLTLRWSGEEDPPEGCVVVQVKFFTCKKVIFIIYHQHRSDPAEKKRNKDNFGLVWPGFRPALEARTGWTWRWSMEEDPPVGIFLVAKKSIRSIINSSPIKLKFGGCINRTQNPQKIGGPWEAKTCWTWRWSREEDPPVGCVLVEKKYNQLVQELTVDRSC